MPSKVKSSTSVKRKQAVTEEKPTNKKVKTEKKSTKKSQPKEISDDELELSSSSEEEQDDSSSSDGSDSESEEEEEDELEEAGDEKDQENSENKTSSKEAHAKQKQIKEERRMAKPNSDVIQNVKTLWERLRVKKGITPEARKKLIAEAWTLSEPILKELALKHDTSRVVQTMIKYSDNNIRHEITIRLEPIFYELAISSYGKYLIIKLLHYAANNQKERDFICYKLLKGKPGIARRLMRHKHGAYVLEDMFRYYASPKYKQEIIFQFFDPENGNAASSMKRKITDKKNGKKADASTEAEDLIGDRDYSSVAEMFEKYPERRPDAMKFAFKRLQAAVEKGSIGFNVVHAVMLNYISNAFQDTSEAREFIDLITEQFPEIVHTPEGSETASIVLSIATAKVRKNLVRALRQFIFELATDDNGCFVLISLFDTIDDTVLIKKALGDSLQEHMPGLLTSKHGRKPLLYLLLGGPNSRYFAKSQIEFINDKIGELKKKTSKKSDEARLREHLKNYSKAMLECVAEYPGKMFETTIGSQTTVEVLLYAIDEEVTEEDGTTVSLKDKALKSLAQTFKGDVKDTSVFKQSFSSRALRILIQGGHWNHEKKQVDVVKKNERLGEDESSNEPAVGNFKLYLHEAILDNIKDWATSNEGSFVVVALLDNLEKKSSEYKELVKGLKKYKKDIEKKKVKGHQIILSHL